MFEQQRSQRDKFIPEKETQKKGYLEKFKYFMKTLEKDDLNKTQPIQHTVTIREKSLDDTNKGKKKVQNYRKLTMNPNREELLIEENVLNQ